MKNLLIIYPHWPPSNLAGVHRPRLIANFLRDFGWRPIVLTVEASYYEEKPDPELLETVNRDVEVFYTKALPVKKPRLIGDIGLRAYPFLYKKARKIISWRRIDFIWIPIPSFYTALLGRHLFKKTGIPYGIDYIDPWVRDISTRKDWRHRLSNLLAKFLEPIAVKKAALITGVSYEYYKPVLERNFRKSRKSGDGSRKLDESKGESEFSSSEFTIHHCAFPYGFDTNDHKIKLKSIKYPWSGEEQVKPWIYAGAFLPNSRMFVEALFQAIAEMKAERVWDEQIHLYFMGTGAYSGKSIGDYAKVAGIADIVSEDRSRYPYLHILNFLSDADSVMILGSTEKHYTPSKVYQSLLSERPVWAIFHKDSTAVQVMEACLADKYVARYEERMGDETLKNAIKQSLVKKLKEEEWNPDLKALDKYSAKESAGKLVEGIEQTLSLSS